MKYIISILSCIGIVAIFLFCPLKSDKISQEYLRIHIRANSNSQADQAIKYQVKDAVVEALIPLLSEADDIEKAKQIVGDNLTLVEGIAEQTLKQHGFFYGAIASLKQEYFPTRSYDEVTLAEGVYDALILNLGRGEGNNWWCLVYPAFCFTQSSNSDNVVYISKIWEIIKNI